MRWSLILEEFNPELLDIKGEKNIVADALSRLDMKPSSLTKDNLAEHFGIRGR